MTAARSEDLTEATQEGTSMAITQTAEAVRTWGAGGGNRSAGKRGEEAGRNEDDRKKGEKQMRSAGDRSGGDRVRGVWGTNT